MTNQNRQKEIDRCRREQQEILNRKDVVEGRAPAWLVTLGIEDWEMEIRFIEEADDVGSALEIEVRRQVVEDISLV